MAGRAHARDGSLVRTILTVLIGTIACLCLASPAGAYLYWANSATGTIGRASPDGSGVNHAFIPVSGTPVGVAVDGTHIYWTEFDAAGTIGRANLDGTGVDEDFITGATNPQGVAVNGSHIYWSNQSSIGRANLDGTDVDHSFIPSINQADAIDLNSTHIYFSDSGNAVGRAELDGSNVEKTLIPVPSFGADNVTLDTRHVYWTQTDASHPVGRANLDGSSVNTTFITTPPRSYNNAQGGVATIGRHVYWAQLAPNSTIDRANLDGTSRQLGLIVLGATSPRGLAVDAGPHPTTTVFGPQGTIATSSVSFSFGDDYAGSTFKCRLDGAGLVPCNAPTAYEGLADGSHTFAVRSTTSWGATELTPVTRQFVVDTTASGSATAKARQEQKGKRIGVKVLVQADEQLAFAASGRIKVGRKKYRLISITRTVPSGASQIKMRPPKPGISRKIAAALDHGKKPRAIIYASLTDRLGNSRDESLHAKLKR